MTVSPPKLARFSPVQMTGITLMVGAVIAGAALFVAGHRPVVPERTVAVSPAQFPHLGHGRQVIAVYEDVNCPHCREFQRLHMTRLMAAAEANQITLVNVEFPFLKDSSVVAAKMFRCTWKYAPEKYYPLRNLLYGKMEQEGPLLGDYVFVLGKKFRAVDGCAKGAEGAALLKIDQDLSARVGVHSTPFVSLNGSPYRGKYAELMPQR